VVAKLRSAYGRDWLTSRINVPEELSQAIPLTWRLLVLRLPKSLRSQQ
jgi:hypothetical protein